MPRAPWPSSQRPRANIPASPPLGTMPKTLTVPLAVAVARLAAPRDEKARATTSPPPGSARACSPERSFHSLIARSCEAVASTSPFSQMARSRHGPVCPLNESAGLSSAGAPEPDGSWKASLAAGRRHHDHRTGAHAAEAHPVQLTRLGPCVEHRGARAVGHAPHPRTAVGGGGRQQLAIAREGLVPAPGQSVQAASPDTRQASSTAPQCRQRSRPPTVADPPLVQMLRYMRRCLRLRRHGSASQRNSPKRVLLHPRRPKPQRTRCQQTSRREQERRDQARPPLRASTR